MIRLRRMPAVMISTERAADEDADEGKVHLVVDYRAGARPVTRPAESTRNAAFRTISPRPSSGPCAEAESPSGPCGAQ